MHLVVSIRTSALLAAVVLTASPAHAQTWTAPRTPWGDPDLQGNYSNKYEYGTPFERPEEFAGRRLEDIQGQELTALVRQRAAEVLLNAPFTGGDPIAGNFGGAPAFYDRFEAAKGSRPWFVVDPPDGRVPPMSAEGQKASARRAAARAAARKGRGPADSYIDRSLYDRCITRGLPGSMMPVNYGNSYRIVQSPGYVAITYEMVHETRVIPLDGRPPVPGVIRQYMGEPRGRWEGDTLVVETTNFRDEPVYRGSNPEALRLIERFTPTSADKLEWSVTVDEPTTWTRAWTFSMPLTRNDDEAVFEYACHEGNRAMANLLSAARAEEKGLVAPGLAAPQSSARDARAAVRTGTAPSSRSGLSGVWVAAQGGRGGGRGNFAGFSTPTRLVISESPDEVTIESNLGTAGQMQSAVYRVDGAEHPAPGPIGWDTRARAARADGKLVITVRRTIEGPAGPVHFEIGESYSVSGDTLTLERSQGSRTQRISYTRTQ
jgi:hypothetical protein